DDRSGPRFTRTEIEEWVFTHDYADRTLRDHFKLLSLDGCGLGGRAAAIGAAGAVLHYLRDTQRAALDHLDRPTYYDRADSMILDAVTVRNLELTEPVFAADAGGPRDLQALGRSIDKIPALKRCFDTHRAARLRALHERLDELPDVAKLILDAIADEPPLNLTDGGTIRAGYNAELGELRDLSQN